MNSSKITSKLTALTKQQSLQCDISKDNLKKPKTEIKKSKKENYKNVIRRLTTEMNDKKTSCEYVDSNWSFELVTVPSITEFGFEFSKQQFWDLIRLRYGWEINNLPTSCSCVSKFHI